MANPPICRECKHYGQDEIFHIHWCLKAPPKFDPIDGPVFTWPSSTPEHMRKPSQLCGPEGKLFEKFIPKPSLLKRLLTKMHEII